MRINLRYRETVHGFGGAEYNKEIDVPQGTDVPSLSKLFGITSVARYIRDGMGSGGFNSKWVSEGSLEEGETYSVTFGKTDKENVRMFKKIKT